MNELIKQEANIVGNVKVELFNVKTGKLDFVEEGSNYISLLGKDAMKRAQRYALSTNTKTFTGLSDFLFNRGWHYTYDTSYFARYLHLTADSQVEDENESSVTQPTVGYADLTTAYSGTDPKIGTVNETETDGSVYQLKFVCDFGTDKANGTFQSIYLSPFATDLDTTAGILKSTYAGKNPEGTGVFSRITADATYYYTFYSGYGLNRINKSTFEATILEPYANCPFNLQGMLHHNGYIYMCSYSNSGDSAYLYRYNLSTNTFEQAPLDSQIAAMMYLTTDGTYIYVFCSTGNSGEPKRVPKLDPVSFTWVNYITTTISDASLSGFNNFFFYGGTLYITSATYEKVYEVDYDTNTTVDTYATKPYLAEHDFEGYDGASALIRHVGYSKTAINYYIYSKPLSEALTENFTFFSRKRLSTPVTKTDTQALKITYTFDFI